MFVYAFYSCLSAVAASSLFAQKCILASTLNPFARDCSQSLEDFTANPDVVEEFYYLVGRFVDYCPEPLVSRFGSLPGQWVPMIFLVCFIFIQLYQ